MQETNQNPDPTELDLRNVTLFYLVLNETNHALRFAESAAGRFAADVDELEAGSKTAMSAAFIKNRLSDAQESRLAAQGEIGRQIHEGEVGWLQKTAVYPPIARNSLYEKPRKN